jgi:hypothetical protein
MAALLTAVTSDGAGSGVSLSGPSSVIVHNDSVFDGATIEIQIADTDTAADYAPVGRDGMFQAAGGCAIDVQGAYYARAVVSGAGSSTSVNAVVIQ